MRHVTATLASGGRGRLNIVRYGVSAIALASVMAALPALAQTAPAQDDEATEVDEVVVTGIRGSLQSAQAIKRNAEVFVDSISAQDIGALPDRSVTEALQRVPGVSIDRFAAGVDPDHFSVEGSGVVVRGLTFVRSEFNGRDAFTANNGRALGFADVPAELLAGVDVFKNQSADLIEGGIAGTVNLRTRVPFDQSGDVLSASAEISYGDLAEEATPTYSILGSKRWDTEGGEFGLLANFVDSQLKSRGDGQQISNFSLRSDLGPTPIYFPRGASFRTQDFDRQRTGYAAAGQWRSPDRTMIATAQFLRSEATQAWTEHAVEIATDNVTSNGDSRPVLGTTFEFGDDGVFTNGTITGPTGWRDDSLEGRDNRTPAFGLQSNNQRRDVYSENVTTDYGFNFKWTPTDRLKFNFDIQRVESTVENLDATTWASTYQNASIQLRGDDVPIVTFLPPSENGVVTQCATPRTDAADCPGYYNAPNANFSDPFNSFFRNNMDHAEDSEGELTAVRLDGEYTFDEDSWLESVRFGYRRAEREQTTRFSAYNWGVVSEQWGGGGPVWLNDSADGVPEPGPGLPGTAGTLVGSRFEPFSFDNFFRGEVPVPTGAQPRLFYNQNIVQNYDAYAAFGLLVGDEWRDRLGADGCPQNWVPLALRCDVVPGTLYRLNEINPVDEQTDAFYGMLRYNGELENGVKLSGNIGLRYTTTDRQAGGYIAFPRVAFSTEEQCANVPPGETATPFCRLVSPANRAAARAFANGAITESTAETTFEYLLPSFNLKAELDGGRIFRFGYSRAITPPDIGLTRNFFNVNLSGNELDIVDGRPTGRFAVGNPYLKPIQADSFDASFEWYYGNPGSFTFSLFYKTLSDVITNGTQRQAFTNNGATFDAVVTTPVNSEEEATVKGFEVAWQHTLDDLLPERFAGFGFNANYTYIDSEGVPQSTLSNTDPDVAAGRIANIDTSLLPLQNLSKHTANLAGFYERGPLAIRLAYAWRSEFLITPRDVIVPFAPIMNEATGQLDGSAFYSLTDQIKIGVQAVNLTNEITRTSQVLNNDLLTTGRSWFINDRRFTFIVRATF